MTSWVPWTTPPFSSTTEEVSEEKGVHGVCLGKASESPLLEKTGNNLLEIMLLKWVMRHSVSLLLIVHEGILHNEKILEVEFKWLHLYKLKIIITPVDWPHF